MKPSTLFQLVAFFALYEVALAAPRASKPSVADPSTTSVGGTDSTPYAGNPSSLLRRAPTTSSSSSESQTTSSLGDEAPTTSSLGDEAPTTSSLGDEAPTTSSLGDEAPTTSSATSPANTELGNTEMSSKFGTASPLTEDMDELDMSNPNSQKANCPDGRLFNIQQACVDHCAGGVCHSNTFNPPIDYTAYEYAFHKAASNPPGNDRPRVPKRGNPPHNGLQGNRPPFTEYEMKVTANKAMQIWVCGCQPGADRGMLHSLATSPVPETPILGSATTTAPGRVPTPHVAHTTQPGQHTSSGQHTTSGQTTSSGQTTQETAGPSSK